MNVRMPAFSAFNVYEGSYGDACRANKINRDTGAHKYRHATNSDGNQVTLVWTDGSRPEDTSLKDYSNLSPLQDIPEGLGRKMKKTDSDK